MQIAAGRSDSSDGDMLELRLVEEKRKRRHVRSVGQINTRLALQMEVHLPHAVTRCHDPACRIKAGAIISRSYHCRMDCSFTSPSYHTKERYDDNQ